MNIPEIIICPQNHADKPANIPSIECALKGIGLLSEKFADKQFYTGSAFLSLLSFLGCSPNINLSPEDGDNYCYITIDNGTDEAIMLGHTNSVIPRCPECKYKFKSWQSINDYRFAKTTIECPACNTSLKMPDLKWRQQAGYGKFNISIANIHPHEAVPSEKLLWTLEQTTGFAWCYFYADNLKTRLENTHR